MVSRVHMESLADRTDIRLALHGSGRPAGRPQCRQQQTDEQGNNAYHHQQLD
jgi:hypothetical protein